jgi:hypothetical protein
MVSHMCLSKANKHTPLVFLGQLLEFTREAGLDVFPSRTHEFLHDGRRRRMSTALHQHLEVSHPLVDVIDINFGGRLLSSQKAKDVSPILRGFDQGRSGQYCVIES